MLTRPQTQQCKDQPQDTSLKWQVSRQAVWYNNLLEEIGYNLKSISLAGNNQSFIFMALNTIQEI